MIKVAIIGPESTGKTTLTESLANYYHTVWVREYSRDYLTNLERPYVQSDLLEIAKGQIESKKAMEKEAKNILFCDTDLYVIKVWSEYKYGECDPWILNRLATQYFDLYILTYYDIPYEDDPLRENPNERPYFFNIYHKLLTEGKQSFIVVKGSMGQRLDQAKKVIGTLL